MSKNFTFANGYLFTFRISHSRRNAFRSVYIDFSIIKSDKSKGLVFGLTGINYGKSHERESVKRVIVMVTRSIATVRYSSNDFYSSFRNVSRALSYAIQLSSFNFSLKLGC